MLEKVTAAEWLGGGVLTVAGAVVGKLIDGLFRLAGDRKKEAAAETSALAEWDRAVAEGGAELLNQFRREFKYLREEQGKSNAEIAALRNDLERAKGDHSRCEAKLEQLRGEITRMMAGDVAIY